LDYLKATLIALLAPTQYLMMQVFHGIFIKSETPGAVTNIMAHGETLILNGLTELKLKYLTKMPVME